MAFGQACLGRAVGKALHSLVFSIPRGVACGTVSVRMICILIISLDCWLEFNDETQPLASGWPCDTSDMWRAYNQPPGSSLSHKPAPARAVQPIKKSGMKKSMLTTPWPQ